MHPSIHRCIHPSIPPYIPLHSRLPQQPVACGSLSTCLRTWRTHLFEACQKRRPAFPCCIPHRAKHRVGLASEMARVGWRKAMSSERGTTAIHSASNVSDVQSNVLKNPLADSPLCQHCKQGSGNPTAGPQESKQLSMHTSPAAVT